MSGGPSVAHVHLGPKADRCVKDSFGMDCSCRSGPVCAAAVLATVLYFSLALALAAWQVGAGHGLFDIRISITPRHRCRCRWLRRRVPAHAASAASEPPLARPPDPD